MIYEDWQNEFSKMMGVPYHYLKELGDHWFDLVYGSRYDNVYEGEEK